MTRIRTPSVFADDSRAGYLTPSYADLVPESERDRFGLDPDQPS